MNSIKIKVKDGAGNVCSYANDVNNDVVPPATPCALVSGDLLEMEQFDSGPVYSEESLYYQLGNNGEWQLYEAPVRIVCTNDTVIHCKAVDAAGNTANGADAAMRANIGVYTSTKDDLRNGEFMLPSGFVRTYNGNTKDWFFAFNANIQTIYNGNALKYTDFYGNETCYTVDKTHTDKYYSIDAQEITCETGAVAITDTVNVSYAYVLKYEAGSVYFDAAGKLCAFVDGNQKVRYNWNGNCCFPSYLEKLYIYYISKRSRYIKKKVIRI